MGRPLVHGAAGAPDRVIAELASRQHGVVARRQLLAAGIGARAVEERLGRGVLHRIHRGVYAVGHVALGRGGQELAAVVASGPSAVLSHRPAAGRWGILPRPGAIVEVTRPGKFRPQTGIRARSSLVPEDERAVVERIPLTSISRTILDLAAAVPRRTLERAMNEAEALGLTDILSLPDLLGRYPGRRGTAVLRALLDGGASVRGVTRSELEERFLVLLEAHGLPAPRLNAAIAAGGRFFEVDCLWREQRLIAELDGRSVHGTRRAFEADRERDRILLAAGWRAIRLTWRQVHDDPAGIALDLRRLLVPRPPTPGTPTL